MLEIKFINESKNPDPCYAMPDDAGMDLRANLDLSKCEKIEGVDMLVLVPGQKMLVPTGLRFSIPSGYEATIRPKSGISIKTDLDVILGTIDSKYVGEVSVIVRNSGDSLLYIADGQKIAQIVFTPVVRAQLYKVESLEKTERGEGGFGSTDDIYMPFGKHKGKHIEDVPASYLLYIYEQGISTEYHRLRNYIQQNKRRLEEKVEKIKINKSLQNAREWNS
jgi:dUTP pyrophosphatase